MACLQCPPLPIFEDKEAPVPWTEKDGFPIVKNVEKGIDQKKEIEEVKCFGDLEGKNRTIFRSRLNKYTTRAELKHAAECVAAGLVDDKDGGIAVKPGYECRTTPPRQECRRTHSIILSKKEPFSDDQHFRAAAILG